MDIVSLAVVIGVMLGGIGSLWFAIKHKISSGVNPDEITELQSKIAKLTSDLELTSYKLSQKEQELAESKLNLQNLQEQYKQEQNKSSEVLNKYQVANEAKARLEVDNLNLHNSYKKLEEVFAQLKQTFNTEFVNLRQLAINELKEKANISLREVGKDTIVEPLQNNLRALQEKIIQLETQTKTMNESSVALNKQAENLAFALTRDSKKKGDFGELILSNLLESVGLQDKISYTEQLQLTHQDKKYIPDMVIHLPHERAVVVDSKNIMKQYYDSVTNDGDNTRLLLSVISATVKNLADKDYASILSETYEKSVFAYAIMFIPNESLFLAILAEDETQNCALIREAYRKKIFIAGPSTLLALLSMIDKAWESYQVEERADEIIKLAMEVTGKIHTTIERVGKLGKSMKTSMSSYNDVIASLDNGRSDSVVAKLATIADKSGEKKILPTVDYIDVETKSPHSYIEGE